MVPTPISTVRATSVAERRPLVLIALAMALLLAACGDDGKETASSQPDVSAGVFPVSVEHKYGATTIPRRPERVVTVGLSDHELVIALGVVPVGVEDWFRDRPYRQWPWIKERWGGVEPAIVGYRDEFDFEKIAALKPDLIIGLYSGMSEEQYRTLSRIAPTVAQPRGFDDYGAPWQEMTRMVGQALGLEERARELIAGIDRRFAEVRGQHPELAGKTVAVVDPYVPGEYAVFSPTDPKARFLTEMGFRVPDQILEMAGTDNAAVISSERLKIVDVDRLVFLTSDATAEERVKSDETYKTLTVAREGRALFLPYRDPPIGAALSFNTVLSIPYAIDQVVPLLTRGAD